VIFSREFPYIERLDRSQGRVDEANIDRPVREGRELLVGREFNEFRMDARIGFPEPGQKSGQKFVESRRNEPDPDLAGFPVSAARARLSAASAS
jgi:hypothetical protein